MDKLLMDWSIRLRGMANGIADTQPKFSDELATLSRWMAQEGEIRGNPWIDDPEKLAFEDAQTQWHQGRDTRLWNDHDRQRYDKAFKESKEARVSAAIKGAMARANNAVPGAAVSET